MSPDRETPSNADRVDLPTDRLGGVEATLAPGERLLWEGAPDATAPTDGDSRFFRAAALVFLALGVAAFVYRLTLAGDVWTLPCADPSLRVELPMDKLDGTVFALWFGAALFALFPACGRWTRRVRRRTRYAVTDRRVLVAVGGRVRHELPRDGIGRVLRGMTLSPARDTPFVLMVYGRRPRPWKPAPQLSLGPLRRADGLACESALLGRAPAAETDDRAASLPPWMPDDFRRRLLADLSPGERILWVGRPVFRRLPPEGVFLAAVVAAALVGLALCDGDGGLRALVSRVPDASRLFFVRIGWPFGWLFGAMALSIWAGLPVAVVAELWWGLSFSRRRREWSRRFFLVTDRRAVSAGPLCFETAPDLVFPPCAKRAGRGRTNLLFATRHGSPPPARPTVVNSLGFLDLPDADLPAALAAIETLRQAGIAEK